MWIVQIVLDNPTTDALLFLSCFYSVENSFHSTTHEDSFALREPVWLDNVGLAFLFFTVRWLVKLVSEIYVISRQHPSLREEIKLIIESSFHPHQVSSEMVLSCDGVHAWVMVDLLVRVEFSQKVRCDTQIMPGHIPFFNQLLVVLTFTNCPIVILWVLPHFVTEYFFSNFPDYIVLCAVYIHEKWTTVVFIVVLNFLNRWLLGLFDS